MEYTEMGHSLIHYFRNFPLRYYLNGGLIRTDGPIVSLFLSAEDSAALVSRRHRVFGFEVEIASLSDAPPVMDARPSAGGTSRSFSLKLLSRCRTKGNPRFVLVPDLGVNDLYCNMHNVANLREVSVESLLESLHEEPRQVIGSWEEPRPFRWVVLSAQLDLVRGSFDRRTQQVMVVGVPAEYCEQLESWTDTQQGSLLAIVPVPVSCLNWFCKMVPVGRTTAFVMLLLSHTVALAVVQNQEVIVFRQYIEDAEFAYHEIPALAEDLRAEDYEVYVWSPRPVSDYLARSLVGTELAGSVLQQINGRSVLVWKADGSRTELNAPVPHLLLWLENAVA